MLWLITACAGVHGIAYGKCVLHLLFWTSVLVSCDGPALTRSHMQCRSQSSKAYNHNEVSFWTKHFYNNSPVKEGVNAPCTEQLAFRSECRPLRSSTPLQHRLLLMGPCSSCPQLPDHSELLKSSWDISSLFIGFSIEHHRHFWAFYAEPVLALGRNKGEKQIIFGQLKQRLGFKQKSNMDFKINEWVRQFLFIQFSAIT